MFLFRFFFHSSFFDTTTTFDGQENTGKMEIYCVILENKIDG